MASASFPKFENHKPDHGQVMELKTVYDYKNNDMTVLWKQRITYRVNAQTKMKGQDTLTD